MRRNVGAPRLLIDEDQKASMRPPRYAAECMLDEESGWLRGQLQ